MRKSSQAISLALIGSSLILSGCISRTPQPGGDGPPDSGRSGPSSGHGGGYYYGGGHYYGGGGVVPAGPVGPAGGKSPAVSPRGGFGGAGHAAGGS